MFATGGAQLFIGDEMQGGALDAAAYAAVSWTEIAGLTNLGRSGMRAEIDTSATLDSNNPDQPVLRKGAVSLDAGSMTILADLNHADAGQQLLWSAVGKASRAFRILLPQSSPTQVRLFVALVASVDEQWNDANSVMQLMSELEIDSNVTRTTL